MDREQMRRLAGAAWHRSRGWSQADPVGGAYYAQCQGLVEKMMKRARTGPAGRRRHFDERLARDYDGRLKVLKAVEAEIRRRLVADRGVEAMARALRELPEDVDMHTYRVKRCTSSSGRSTR